MIINASQEAITKDRVLASSSAQMVFDVAGGFLQVKGFEVKADGNTLVEGFVRSETELVSEVRLTEEDERDQRGRVHIIIEKKA